MLSTVNWYVTPTPAPRLPLRTPQAGRLLLASNIQQAFSIARAIAAIVFVGFAALSCFLTYLLWCTAPAAHAAPSPVRPRALPATPRVRPDSVVIV
jgi:hypothetical protein